MESFLSFECFLKKFCADKAQNFEDNRRNFILTSAWLADIDRHDLFVRTFFYDVNFCFSFLIASVFGDIDVKGMMTEMTAPSIWSYPVGIRVDVPVAVGKESVFALDPFISVKHIHIVSNVIVVIVVANATVE